ncbi:Conserved_hypothetical protein [Hexamita inflata]|uniref:Uncharacterized protein n=1 Tax=Hexamita inflata TaxID=28002 RepID=A0AA86TSH6_9EUKA|nr:Conserved hypothetical protein [Hexamita inflata]
MLQVSILLAAILLDADGREIHTCYTYDTTVEYRPNIKQLLILLVPNNNSACDIFPAGANINVTIGNTDFATTVPLPVYLPYSYTISNFGYQNTTQIAVEGFSLPLDGLGDEISIDFLLIEIYSYAEITRIEILEMQTIISSLSECFYADMPMLVTKDSLYISMNATGLCRIQIGALKSIQVTIEGKQFSFDLMHSSLVDLKTNYNHNVKFNLNLNPGAVDSFSFTAQKPDIAATAYLLTNDGAIDTRIDLVFSEVKYDTILNFYSLSSMSLNDKAFIFTIISKPQSLTALRAKLLLTGYTYNKRILRLIVTTNEQSYTFDYITSKYNALQLHFPFKCSDQPSNQQQQCLTFYEHVRTSSNVKITISALFFYNDNILAVQHNVIDHIPQVFERVYFNVGSGSQSCLHLQNTVQNTFGAEVTNFKFNIMRADNYSVKGNFEYNVVYDHSKIEICFNDALLQDAVRENFMALMIMSQGDKQYVHVFQESKNNSQQDSILANYILVTVFSIATTVFVAVRLFIFGKRIKSLKKKKN